MLKRIGPSGTLAIVIGCLASTAFAQGGNAVINGTVFDQAKAVLPGVTVTVTNEATGITREAVTGRRGAVRRADADCRAPTPSAPSSLASRRRRAQGSSCASARS